MPDTALGSGDTAIYNIVGELDKKQANKMGRKISL